MQSAFARGARVVRGLPQMDKTADNVPYWSYITLVLYVTLARGQWITGDLGRLGLVSLNLAVAPSSESPLTCHIRFDPLTWIDMHKIGWRGWVKVKI